MQAGIADINALTADERNILLMICSKLICATGEKHVFSEKVVTVVCCDEVFTTKGKTIIGNGWKQVEEDLVKSLGIIKKESNEDAVTAALSANLSEGQQFTAETSIREGFTSPPKHYTEDTLLSAMETAGVEGVTEEIERRGIGTPATRAGILEGLVKNELLKRDKKNILPTEKGIALIEILPDKVKSPLLTASWENDLKRMERGEVTPNGFMQSIKNFVGDVVSAYGNIAVENNPFGGSGAGDKANGGEVIGTCPRCGGKITESPKAFSCENMGRQPEQVAEQPTRARSKSCGFALWKDNKWFASQGKKINKAIATALVNNGKVFIKDLKSQKSGKTYNATVILDDNRDGFVNFKLDFGK